MFEGETRDGLYKQQTRVVKKKKKIQFFEELKMAGSVFCVYIYIYIYIYNSTCYTLRSFCNLRDVAMYKLFCSISFTNIVYFNSLT